MIKMDDKSSKKSPIWKFFIINAQDNTKAVCLLCNNNISRGKSGNPNTTNMIGHLQRHHVAQYLEYQKSKKDSSDDKTTIKRKILTPISQFSHKLTESRSSQITK